VRNTKLRNPGSCDDTREQSPGYNFMVSRIFAYARSANRIRGRRVRVDIVEVYLPRRNVRVQKGDAEKCACGANGGECNATRTEPAAECSFEPNSEAVSSLGYCTQKQERREEEGKKEMRGKERTPL